MEAIFLTILPRPVVTPSSIGTRGPLERRISGKDTSRATIGSNGPKCWTLLERAKRPHSFGPFGIRRWRSTNGGLKLHRHQSPSNVFFVCLIRVNRLNISFGIASKPGELGDGLLSSCMNFAGLGPAITIVSIGNKRCSGKGFRRSIVRKSLFGIYLEGSLFGPFGLSVMTKCSIKNNGIYLRSNTRFGMNLSSMPKLLGSGFWSKSRRRITLRRP